MFFQTKIGQIFINNLIITAILAEMKLLLFNCCICYFKHCKIVVQIINKFFEVVLTNIN